MYWTLIEHARVRKYATGQGAVLLCSGIRGNQDREKRRFRVYALPPFAFQNLEIFLLKAISEMDLTHSSQFFRTSLDQNRTTNHPSPFNSAETF